MRTVTSSRAVSGGGAARPAIFGALLLVALLGVRAVDTPAGAASAVRLFAFDDNETTWIAVNDGVMGGASSGRVLRKDGVLTFSGRVSLKNNGGFASTRSNSKVTPIGADARAFVFRAKADGTTYQFTVDTTEGWFWAPTKPTQGSWNTVRVGFADLQPVTRFGEPTKRRAFDGSQEILTTGFLIANKRAEKFALSIDWIDADG